ncbi:hypothetical protein NLJ89_g10063 [Agrocybe chaxingu]|uniref:Pyridoxamine 5'-phosphate oxidase Alr4036 family FMN-binding domain-containing protein n=1 Tax=Agrocybe chaxingu TaxID=84603 RepID=A0A9W8JSE9_9AGAR|nr:hypothetical protein NLJ89_g10063 [Agrocybe chaxingu]
MASPRWKIAIEKALSQYKQQNVMQVATLDTSSSLGTISRVRSQIFRDWLESPQNASLPLLLTSTDIRAPKVSQLTASSKAEVVWWIEGTAQQFRIIADIYTVPHPEHALHSHFLDVLAKSESGTGLALFINEDWEARRVALFKTMGAHMKASWCRPVPGSPLKGDPAAGKEKYEEAKRNWETALGNFALMIIDPIEVDFVDLSTSPDKRTLFTKKVSADDGVQWEETDLVP